MKTLSFCITCKNRFHQINQTLAQNLDDNRESREYIEFVLVDFGSTDGLHDWVIDNFRDDLESGYLKYYYTEGLPFWHCSIAKNTSHLLASNDILVNLDCDNFTGHHGGQFVLRRWMNRDDKIVLHQFNGHFFSGTFGRIATDRKSFLAVGGYDESFEPASMQDQDIIRRLVGYGLKCVDAPDRGYNRAIKNSKDETLAHVDSNFSYVEMLLQNRAISDANFRAGNWVVNRGKQWGIRENIVDWQGRSVNITRQEECISGQNVCNQIEIAQADGEKALVSVVVPVYNDALLSSTLMSVLSQSHDRLEVLVVDDGSTEDIESMVRKFGDNRLHYHRLPHTNANVARNYGIQKATGDYIAMLDADDLWLPNHVEECLKKIKETGADAVYGSLIVRNITSGTEHPVIVHGPREGETMINYLLRTGFGAQTSTLFMTAASAKDVPWDETLLRHQDYDFVARYSKCYSMAARSDEPTVVYRQSPKESKIDLRSCIRVIDANADDIEPDVYMRYNQNMLDLAIEQQADADIIKHYRTEATRIKEYISFVKFLQIRAPKSDAQIEELRKEYIDYLTVLEVEL